MDLMQLIPEQLLGLVTAPYVVGFGIKKSKVIRNNCIPIILLCTGIVISISLQGLSPGAILEGTLSY